MRYLPLLIFFLGVVFGIGGTRLYFALFKDPSVAVRVIDHSHCSLREFSLILSSYTLQVGPDRISRKPTGLAADSDTTVRVLTPQDGQYSLLARFDKCPDRKTEPRSVKPGDLMYEWVDKDGINADLR
jgi:hypothetical protein